MTAPPRVAGVPLTPAVARGYFGAQALAGALWWMGVFTLAPVRSATLGELPVLLLAATDIPLFVIGSTLSALGLRWAVRVTTGWTVCVAAAMAVYATWTTQAGWGALLMAAAAAGSITAGIVITMGRAPVEWIVTGPFAFRTASRHGRGALLARTGTQTLFFWGLFLVVLPLVIAALEARWMLRMPVPGWIAWVGAALLAAATALGVWSAVSMTVRGEGTPLPSQMPRRLVISGPYRLVRNPMAVAGIAQGVAVGLILGSWLVVLYALAGSLFWNAVVRPLEEADLAERFGAEFEEYRGRVACWVPTLRRAL